MRLDIDAGTIDGKSLLLFTQSHELTHYIQKWSPEKYKVFADFLMEKYAKSDVPVQKLIEQKIEESKISATMDKSGKHHVLTESEAFDEIVANAIPETNVFTKIIVSIGAFAIGDIAYDKVSSSARDFMYDFGSKLDSSIKAAKAQAKQLDEITVES
jgi:hypothetical protein